MTRWVEGPPPGPGRYWVAWSGWDDGVRVEVVEIGPALIARFDPNAPLLIKTFGLAFRLDVHRANLTHHMSIEPPALPQVVA